MSDVIADFEEPADEKLLFGDDTPGDENAEGSESEGNSEVLNEGADSQDGFDLAKKEDEVDETREKQRDKVIPRERFDEVHSKYKAEQESRERVEEENARLAAELEALKNPARDASAGAVDIIALEKEFFIALDNGDEEKALQVRAKINEELVNQADLRAEARELKREQQREAVSRQTEIDIAISSVLTKYPELETADGKQSPALAEVIEMRDFYIFKGMSAPAAIIKAADKVLGGGKASSPTIKEDPRRQDMLKRNADAANRQPPRLDGVGDRSIPNTLVAAVKGKQEDWEKIPRRSG